MENKDLIGAANALIEWFNSQEISRSDAKRAISKVLAKIIVAECTDAANRPSLSAITESVDLFTLQLVHDINQRSFDVRR